MKMKMTTNDYKKIFGSRCRVKLLRIFFENPGDLFYMRELEAKTKEGFNGVRRELNSLEKLGLLLRTNIGSRAYFKLRVNNLAVALASVFDIEL